MLGMYSLYYSIYSQYTNSLSEAGEREIVWRARAAGVAARHTEQPIVLERKRSLWKKFNADYSKDNVGSPLKKELE